MSKRSKSRLHPDLPFEANPQTETTHPLFPRVHVILERFGPEHFLILVLFKRHYSARPGGWVRIFEDEFFGSGSRAVTHARTVAWDIAHKLNLPESHFEMDL